MEAFHGCDKAADHRERPQFDALGIEPERGAQNSEHAAPAFQMVDPDQTLDSEEDAGYYRAIEQNYIALDELLQLFMKLSRYYHCIASKAHTEKRAKYSTNTNHASSQVK